MYIILWFFYFFISWSPDTKYSIYRMWLVYFMSMWLVECGNARHPPSGLASSPQAVSPSSLALFFALPWDFFYDTLILDAMALSSTS